MAVFNDLHIYLKTKYSAPSRVENVLLVHMTVLTYRTLGKETIHILKATQTTMETSIVCGFVKVEKWYE